LPASPWECGHPGRTPRAMSSFVGVTLKESGRRSVLNRGCKFGAACGIVFRVRWASDVRLRVDDVTTIRDVAEWAQVSVGTVSRVMNGHPSVSPAIRRVVLEAIDELQYQPNAAARTLRTAKTQTLGFLSVNMRNAEVAAAAITGAEAAAHEHGYALFVANTRRDPAVEERYLRNLLGRRVDGLLCPASMDLARVHQLVQQAGVPTVVFGQPQASDLLPSTMLNFASATEEAIDHLRGLGHERIGTITHVSDAGLAQTVGWGASYIHHALRQRGIDGGTDNELIVQSTAECTLRVTELLTRRDHPTAFLITPLYLVPSTIAGIRAAEASVPADVSVIGFGDSSWAEIVEPPISVIAADLTAYLDASTRLLISLINGGQAPIPPIEHHAHYIRRGSVMPARC
jgi:LacI family transcriptional regulator